MGSSREGLLSNEKTNPPVNSSSIDQAVPCAGDYSEISGLVMCSIYQPSKLIYDELQVFDSLG